MQPRKYSANRREVLKALGAAGAAVAAGGGIGLVTAKAPEAEDIGAIELPYPVGALEPHISARTVDTHYNRHHKTYADRLEGYLRANPQYKSSSLEKIILSTKEGITIEESVHAMATLTWNHNLYWRSMKPQGGIPAKPSGRLAKAVEQSFGSIEGLRNAIVKDALRIGVGWVWLLWTGNGLKVDRTDYHTSPIARGETPLLTIDVWEHAYYPDYLDKRNEYVENILTHLLNWELAEQTLASVQRGAKR